MSTPQSTETNLIGYLTTAIGIPDASIAAIFYDKVNGTQRTPDPKTKLFVMDKGSANQPNVNYEIVLCSSHSTVNGVTTLAGVTRGLAWTGTSLAAGTGKSHVANAEIGPVDVHYLTTILASQLDGTDSIDSALNFGKRWVYSGTGVLAARVFADATARDAAITAPQNGDIVYNTAVGLCQKYIGGAWIDDTAGGAVPNASETVAGKIELATNAEMRAGTSTGATGARLVPPNDQLVATSAGAADQGKIPTLGSNGLDGSTMPANLQAAALTGTTNITGTELETLSAGSDASALHNHGGGVQANGSNHSDNAGNGGGAFSHSFNIDLDMTPYTSSTLSQITFNIYYFITVSDNPGNVRYSYGFAQFTGTIGGEFGGWSCARNSTSASTDTAFFANPSPTTGGTSSISCANGSNASASLSNTAPSWSGSNARFAFVHSGLLAGSAFSNSSATVSATVTKLA